MSSRSKRQKSLPAASLYVVLALLDGELHGYAVMQRVMELSDGAVKMGPGTLFTDTADQFAERSPGFYLNSISTYAVLPGAIIIAT